MKRFSSFFPYLFLCLVAVFFFQKTIFKGLVPFPGDLLASEYQPWRSLSLLGYAPGAIPQKAQYFDTLRQLYPWKTLTIGTFKSGQFPLWNPFNFSGSPLLANNQSAVFYPLNVLYGIFSQIQAWTILIVLQPLLASLFMYLYCRRLSLSPASSVLSALAYGYSLFMSVFLEYNTLGHVMLWLPLALWAAERGRERISTASLGVFGFSVLAAGFAGHLQLFIVMLIFVFFYSVLRLKKLVRLSSYLAILLLSLGIGAIQHVPTWELLGNSARASHPYKYLVDTLLVQPHQLLKFISPDIFGNPAARNYLPDDSYPSKALYVGLIPFILALAALFSRQKNELVRTFSGTTALLLLMTIRNPASELIYRFPIPFLSTSSPTNAIFLLSFSLAVLAGFGLDHIQKTKKRLLVSITGVAAVLLLAWVLTITQMMPMQKNNLIYTTLLLGASSFGFVLFWKNPAKRFALGFILFLTIFDLYYFFNKFNPFVPAALVFPDTNVTTWLRNNAGISRYWGYGTAAVPANVGTQFGIFSPDGYDPLYPRRYGELIGGSANGKITGQFTNQTRSDAQIVPGFGETDIPSNLFRLKLLKLLGVRYILDRQENGSTEKTFPKELFNERTRLDDWRIFEYKNAFSRAWLTQTYDLYSTKEQFEKKFFDPSFDPQHTVLLEEDPALSGGSPSGNFTEITRYDVNSVAIRTSSNAEELLVLTDTYFPGWTATIDEKPVKIYRAFWAFRAVPVPKGTHTVMFTYMPQSFLLGGKVTIISMILFIIAIYALPKTFASYRFHHRVGSPIL